ncbi:MAG: SAM-dependent methyltransferase [Bacteroidetes bacterium MedPE-SWsnd-G2]|nr:MAG: SAM-dependent methyltransferase [Bacteroidetes bacterium MedPE-SWsnd-G2]
MATANKSHWENIYTTKSPNQVSWTQDKPNEALTFLEQSNISKSDNIIDIGGGDSLLVDHLLEMGYTNITVLDISEAAINRAKKRLDHKAENVTWITSDILEFKPDTTYQFWYDRAVFHFLTDKADIAQYKQLVNTAADKNLVIGTFSKKGPLKCSGLEISQYSESSLSELFSEQFDLKHSKTLDHKTPFDTIQNFTFCHMVKNN